jgi:hypothetical protein
MKNRVTLFEIDLHTPHNGTEYNVFAKYLVIDCPKDAPVIIEIENMQFEANKISVIQMNQITKFKVYSSAYNGILHIYALNCGAKIDSTQYTLDDLTTIISTVAKILKGGVL